MDAAPVARIAVARECMIAALIFDFDGLLVDTETPALESWRSIYREYGCELTMEVWAGVLGTSGTFDAPGYLVSLLQQRRSPIPPDLAALRARRNEIKQQLCARQPLLPGVLVLLDQADARRLPCAVASSSSRAWVEGWLRQHAIYERFACIRTAEDVAQTKPSPDLFLSAAACLDMSPPRCLVFEDSPNGILAARAAGMPCVAVPGAISGQVALPPADLLLSSLDALPLDAILTQIEQRL